MKRLLTLVALFPGAAFAHGGHAPVHDVAHGLKHAEPVIAALVIAGVIGYHLAKRWRP